MLIRLEASFARTVAVAWLMLCNPLVVEMETWNFLVVLRSKDRVVPVLHLNSAK